MDKKFRFEVGDTVFVSQRGLQSFGKVAARFRSEVPGYRGYNVYAIELPETLHFQEYDLNENIVCFCESVVSDKNTKQNLVVGDSTYPVQVLSPNTVQIGCQRVNRKQIDNIIKAMNELK